MITFGLIGFPLGHSWSAKYFLEKFSREKLQDRTYKLFPLESIEYFTEFINRNSSISGLNVTIPFKEKIIPYLDELDELASQVGAVNTIKFSRREGKLTLKGFNTDAGAFASSTDFTAHSKALILGSGGGAKAVKFALDKLGIQSTFVSRIPQPGFSVGYEELTSLVIVSHTLIVNSTPMGMYPSIESFPSIPYKYLTNEHFLYDLVYNPESTIFLQRGAEYGAKIQNGLRMLQLQAEAAYRIWLE